MEKEKGVLLIITVFVIVLFFSSFSLNKKGLDELSITGYQVYNPPLTPPLSWNDLLQWMRGHPDFRNLDNGIRSDINRFVNALSKPDTCDDAYVELQRFISENFKSAKDPSTGQFKKKGFWKGFPRKDPQVETGLKWLRTLRDYFPKLSDGSKLCPPLPRPKKNVVTVPSGGRPPGGYTKYGDFFRHYRKPPASEGTFKPLGPSSGAFPKTVPTWFRGPGTPGGAYQVALFFVCEKGDEIIKDIRLDLQEDPMLAIPWYAALKGLYDMGYNVYKVIRYLKDLGHPVTQNDLMSLPPPQILNLMYSGTGWCSPTTGFNLGKPNGFPKPLGLDLPGINPVTPPTSNVCDDANWFKNRARFTFIQPGPSSQGGVIVSLFPTPYGGINFDLTVEQNGAVVFGPVSAYTNYVINLYLAGLCGTFTIKAKLNYPYGLCEEAVASFNKDCYSGIITPLSGNGYAPTQVTPPDVQISPAPTVPPTPPDNVICGSGSPFNPSTQNCQDTGTCQSQGKQCDSSTCACKDVPVTTSTPLSTGQVVFERTVIEGYNQQLVSTTYANYIEIIPDQQLIYINKYGSYDPLDIGKETYIFDRRGRFLKQYVNNNLVEERIYYKDTQYVSEIRYPGARTKLVFIYDANDIPTGMIAYKLDHNGNYKVIDQDWYLRYNHPEINEYYIADIFNLLPGPHSKPYYNIFEDKRENFVINFNDEIRIVEEYIKILGNTLLASQKLYINDVFNGEVRFYLDYEGSIDVIIVIDSTGSVIGYYDVRYGTQICSISSTATYVSDIFFPIVMQGYVYKYNNNNFCQPGNMLLDIIKNNGQSAIIYDPYPSLYITFKSGLSSWFELIAADYILENFL